MINAQEARKIAEADQEATYLGIIKLLDRKVNDAAKRGYFSIYYCASTDNNEVLAKIRENLLDFGYGVTEWEETKMGWQIRISW